MCIPPNASVPSESVSRCDLWKDKDCGLCFNVTVGCGEHLAGAIGAAGSHVLLAELRTLTLALTLTQVSTLPASSLPRARESSWQSCGRSLMPRSHSWAITTASPVGSLPETCTSSSGKARAGCSGC